MKYLVNPSLTALTIISSCIAFAPPNLATTLSDRSFNSDRTIRAIKTDRSALAQIKISQLLDFGFGDKITYVSSRAIADNKVEVIWEYKGTRYTFQSTVDSYYIQNEAESRQARGSEREALRTAYDEYKRSGGYRPANRNVTYISSRPIADNTVEVIWDYRGNRYTFQSQLDSYYIRSNAESRQARDREREALRTAYDEYKRSGGYRPTTGTPVGGGITYISSRAIADNTVEVILEYKGNQYPLQSQVNSYYIRNRVESRPARGGERQALRLAYDEYKRSGGYQPTTSTPVSGGITYISSRSTGDNSVEVIWEYKGNRYTFQSQVDSYYIRNNAESRQARSGERDALRIAYDRYKQQSTNNPSNSNNGLLKARSAYNTILVDREANFVIGVPKGNLIYVKCSDIQRIEGDKRVFAMDVAGNQGYILTNAVSGASCNW